MQQLDPAPDVRERRTDTPPGLAAAIARALEKERGRRWATALEMRTAIGSE
jgi:hypothetical protein